MPPARTPDRSSHVNPSERIAGVFPCPVRGRFPDRAAVAAWRLDALARRRERGTLCKKCGYETSGLAPGSDCPECGAATVAA